MQEEHKDEMSREREADGAIDPKGHRIEDLIALLLHL
jgi:hypothetical protein